LAFATRAVDAPHRIETPAWLLFRGIPVRAVRRVTADPKVDPDVPDSSHGVHRSPLRRHDRRCVHTRLSRRPDFGTGLPHPEHVPFLPFLPASTVSSAEDGSEDPSLRQPAGLLHPAAGHGVHQVSDSLARPLGRARPEGRGPEGPGESSPVAITLRSVPLLDSLRPCRHRVSSFRTRPRTPAGVPSRRSEPRPLACRHAALLCSPTSGLSSVEESVAVARRFRCATARCSLGLWIDSFPMLPRVSRRPDMLDVSPGGPTASASPTRTSREGKVFRPCLAPCDRGCGLPRREDRNRSRWLRHLPKEAPRPHPTQGPEGNGGMPVDPPREEVPPRRSRRPKTRGCRRDRDASPKRLVRDPALAPKSGAGGSSSCSPSFRGRPRT
jgi:hypothetical protein